MSKLWKPSANCRKFAPQSLEDMREASNFLERFLPYERLYANLTPEELRELLRDAKRLRWNVLDLRCCGLSDIPDTLAELKDLRTLALGNLAPSIRGNNNAFKKLPDCVTRLTNLQALSLGKTQISALPDCVTRLTSLQALDLSATQISALPDSIENLTSLQSLSLNLTQISALPDCVTRLTSLQSLDLSATRISALPDSIGNLTSLQSLYLSNTEISALPDSIGDLKNLQSLDLHDTQISALPDFAGNLKKLQKLDLCGCHLKVIPYSVVALGLPFVIDNEYTHENCVNLTGVTLDEGDLQLFAQGRDMIEAHYQKQTQVRECKVIFLGDGGAGKTALIQRITKGTFTPETPPTDGVKETLAEWFMSVEMQKWSTEVEDKPFTLRFLDFGGQEIMHAAHCCFLTAHTVYVVVCDGRKDQQIDDTAASWLESVNDFAHGCPVILALNKSDLNANASVNERDLKQRNPALKQVLKTSAKSGSGVEQLKEAIRNEIPGAINDYKVNADMLSVKQALETMPDNYISSKRYREICAEHHITDETLQYDLLGFFRDLGVAYYYESKALDTRLESVRVLNPEWLTNGIYRLILRTPESGFLRHGTIKETLRASHAGDIHREITYTPEETEYILHVMRYFEISHDMGDGVEMIPMKMPKTPPASADEFPKKDALHLRWEGTYLPNNLIHRLLIRKFPELDTKCVWRTGGRFRQIGGGCEALAEMNDKALDVYVSGERDCRQYLESFRGVIWNILDGLNLKTKEIICHTVNGQEGQVSYQAALSHLYRNKDEIYLDNIDAFVSPVILLKEVYVDVDKELKHYRHQLAHTPSLPDKPPEKAESPLDDEEKQANIDKARAEIRQINVKVTLTVALAVLIATVAFLRPDLIEQLLGWLFPLPGGL